VNESPRLCSSCSHWDPHPGDETTRSPRGQVQTLSSGRAHPGRRRSGPGCGNGDGRGPSTGTGVGEWAPREEFSLSEEQEKELRKRCRRPGSSCALRGDAGPTAPRSPERRRDGMLFPAGGLSTNGSKTTLPSGKKKAERAPDAGPAGRPLKNGVPAATTHRACPSRAGCETPFFQEPPSPELPE